MKLPDVAPPGHQNLLKTRSFSMPTGAAPTILAGISHVGSQGLLASLGITSRSMPATSFTNDAAKTPFLVKVHWFYLPPSCSKDGSPFVRGHLQGWFPNDLDLVWNSEDNNCRLVCWTAMGEVQETQFDTGPVR